MNWRRWPWLEQGALPVSVLLLRLFWLWPWLLLIGRWTLPPEMRPVLPFWLIAALMAGGALTARALPVDPVNPGRERAWAALIGLLAMLLTLWWRIARADYALWDVRWIADQALTLTHWNGLMPLSLGVLALSAFLWWRGMQDSELPNHDDIWRAFAGGFVALVLLLIAGRMDPQGPLPDVLTWIVLFFAVGLAALSLAGLRTARGMRDRSASLPVNRYWFASIVTIVAVLTVVGLLLAFLVTPEGVARTMGWVGYISSGLLRILGFILYGLVYVVFLALTPLIYWLEDNVGEWLQFNIERMANMQQGVMEAVEQPAAVTVPPAVDEGMRWLVLAIALIFVALAFAGALRMLSRRISESEDEIRETVLTQSLLRDQAASLLKRWRDRLRRGSSGDESPYLSLQSEPDARRRIRAAYQAFLAAMTVHVASRRPRQTPRGYAASLRDLVPAQADAVDALTDAYLLARYDSRELADEDAARAESAWVSIRDDLAERAQQ